MIAGIFFSIVRISQILTLIPTVGLLAYFVHQYVSANRLTPGFILVLFITSVLALAWCIATLIRRKSTRRSAHFISFIDLCFIGAFIAGVYELRGIAKQSCVNFRRDGSPIYVSLGSNGAHASDGLDSSVNKECAMLKAAFAFGIMNTIFFAASAFFLVFMYRQEKEVVTKETYRRSSHGSRYFIIFPSTSQAHC